MMDTKTAATKTASFLWKATCIIVEIGIVLALLVVFFPLGILWIIVRIVIAISNNNAQKIVNEMRAQEQRKVENE